MEFVGTPNQQTLNQHKRLLNEFFLEFTETTPRAGRRLSSIKPKEETLAELINMGDVVLHYEYNAHNRAHFNEKKKRIPALDNFATSCFACHGRPEVRHHIIWLSNGGRNVKANIIALCRPCHAEIHPWLK